MLQETLLAAWRGLDRFERRASLRNGCPDRGEPLLNALPNASRRPPAARNSVPKPARVTEPTWLERYPDLLLEGIIDAGAGPARSAADVACRAHIRRQRLIQEYRRAMRMSSWNDQLVSRLRASVCGTRLGSTSTAAKGSSTGTFDHPAGQ